MDRKTERERERKMRVREPSGNRYRKSLPKQLRKPEIVMVVHDQSHYTSFYISGLHHASEVVSLELPCLVAARSNLCWGSSDKHGSSTWKWSGAALSCAAWPWKSSATSGWMMNWRGPEILVWSCAVAAKATNMLDSHNYSFSLSDSNFEWFRMITKASLLMLASWSYHIPGLGSFYSGYIYSFYVFIIKRSRCRFAGVDIIFIVIQTWFGI